MRKLLRRLMRLFFLAWTTTPWTLPSNLGLTVGANIEYSIVKTFNPYTHLPINVILATVLIQNILNLKQKIFHLKIIRKETN